MRLIPELFSGGQKPLLAINIVWGWIPFLCQERRNDSAAALSSLGLRSDRLAFLSDGAWRLRPGLHQEALFAWAPAETDLIAWNQRLSALYALVAYSHDGLVGFGSIDLQKSYLDHLFVHESWQRQSVGSLLCDALESKCRRPILTEASITAKPFFEKRGYRVIAEQWVCRRGVKLKNYWMKLT